MGKKKKKKKKFFSGFKNTRDKLIAEGYIEIEDSSFSTLSIGCSCTRDNFIQIYDADCKLHGNVTLR